MLEPFPILFVGKRIDIGSHGLVNVDAQGSVKLFGCARDLRQAQVVRLHHDGGDSDWNAEPYATLRLLMDEFPIAVSALCILLCLCRVIERELNVVKGAQLVIFQDSNTVAVRSDSKFDG